MPRLTLAFSRPAAAEYDEITAFSAERFGASVAQAYMAGLDAALELLCEFPEMAREDRRFVPPARILTYRSHRVFYRMDGETVLVLRILHHARDTPVSL